MQRKPLHTTTKLTAFAVKKDAWATNNHEEYIVHIAVCQKALFWLK